MIFMCQNVIKYSKYIQKGRKNTENANIMLFKFCESNKKLYLCNRYL